MPNVIDTYRGDLYAKCVHVSKHTNVMVEVFRNSFGRADSFEPPDSISAGLGTGLLLPMGIYAKAHGLDSTGADAEVLMPGPRMQADSLAL